MKTAEGGLRVVIDSNVFVSGVIVRRGRPFDLLEAWRAGEFVLLMSDEQRAELERVLHRSEIQGKYGLSAGEVATIFRLLDKTASRAPQSAKSCQSR